MGPAVRPQLGSMPVNDSGLKGLLQLARRAARRRNQRLSTAHALLVMLQHGMETGGLLASRGVREGDLLSALKCVPEEPPSAVEVAAERAHKVALALGESEARPIHFLFAITRDRRTAGHRCLEKVGTPPAALRAEVASLLGAENLPEAMGSRAARATLPRLPTGGLERLNLSPPGRSTAGRPNRRTTPSRARPEPTVRPAEEASPPKKNKAPAPRPPASRARPKDERTTPAPAEAPRPDLSPANELPAESFPLLAALGRNLTALAARGEIDPVLGRDSELELLLDILARRRANNPLLVGPPGVGKTALVEGLALRLVQGGPGVRGLEGRVLIELSAGSLVSGTSVRGALAERMRQLREEVQRSEGRVLLFIDEVHAVVGGDGPDDLASELKASLARGEIPCIGATTDTEFRRHLERDAAFARRFSPVRVVEPTAEQALRILQGVAAKYARHHQVVYEPPALRAAVDLSVRYLTDRQLPDKAIGIVDHAGARIRRRGGNRVDVAAVAAVVSERAGVPLERLLSRDRERLLDLESRLANRVVGHERAIARISDTLRKGAAGLRGKRPIGTLLLLGPSGVGKTEMAKAVADAAFPTGAMTRLDMSELSESHAVARLLGAPPGYVGHEEGGYLTEAVRRCPYQLVLLDEMEKAHRDVQLALLPLLDEGRLTDARGRTVDFSHTIIFMTTNLGSSVAAAPPRIGFGEGAARDVDLRKAAETAARAALPPELWNRIDEPIWFGPLSASEVEEIARRTLLVLRETVQREANITLEIHDSACRALVAAGGYDATLGARPMKRTIGRLVETPLANAILAEKLGEKKTITVRGEGDRVVLVAGDVEL